MNIKLLFLLICCFCFNDMKSQIDETFEDYKARRKQAFDSYTNARRKEFDEYRRKQNEAFAELMRKAWSAVNPSPVNPRPKVDPVPPVTVPIEDTIEVITPVPLPFDEVVPAPVPLPQPQPIRPIEEIPAPEPVRIEIPPTKAFTFYGTEGRVRYDVKNAIRLSSLSEETIADAWLKLSEDAYTNLIYDCLQIRRKRNLCDWAYLTMLRNMAESVYGKESNEAVMLMAFVYCQSGYKMRLAIGDEKLYMLFASEHLIYDWNYFMIEGERYYTYNNQTGRVRVCEQAYPKEQSLSLLINGDQMFAMSRTSESKHHSKRNEDMRVSMAANQNMLDFYTSYPTSMIGENFVSRWAMYANAPMPRHIKETVYPQIRRAISGCDQRTAVNKILNFIQTGFEYGYDDKVWGDDRAFFPEESLFYPYCDCEDRSILLTRIVRDLLGLKCILVYYPGHLASAIAFTEGSPAGDYIALNGRRFFIADATITGYGAPVGVTMQNMNNKTAKVILLD